MNISERIRTFQCFLITAALTQFVGCSDNKTTTGPSNVNTTIAPVITSVKSTLFTVGKFKSFTFTATGTPTPKITLTGTLPTGLAFNDTTSILSGTAGVGTSGSYPLTLTASNGVSPNAVDNVALTVSQTVLIVHDGSVGTESDVVANLSSKVTAASLTPSTSVGIPAGNLNSFVQIWDVRYNNHTPLTAGDISSYTLYLAGGGSLFVIGENTVFVTRNSSINNLIKTLGGDTLLFMNPNNHQGVQSPFTGPNAVDSVTFRAGAGTSNPGSGAFVTKDTANTGTSIVYWPGTLPNALAGRVLIVFDINFLQAGADARLQNLTANMIALP